MKIIILYSGGKDSQASLIWAVNKYGSNNCEAVFCDTGFENSITYEHINKTTNDLNVKLIVVKSKKYNGMVDLAKQKKRFPSVKARFCTEELKSKPAIDYILEQNQNLIIIEGIRKNESLSRSKMEQECSYFKYYFQAGLNGKKHNYRKKEVLKWCNNYNADKVRPIFNWTAEETIKFIQDNGQDVNLLYYQGFSRVGCWPCIMSRHSEVKQLLKLYPERFNKIKELEIEVGSSFFKIDYIPKRFQTGTCTRTAKKFTKAVDIEKYLNEKNSTIDIFEENTTGCMSAYNLCE
jgi:3'-phosphoadenosine 5'-phosphosulfate sulfotransferase (PAPS reductase)/FAD synthetase